VLAPTFCKELALNANVIAVVSCNTFNAASPTLTPAAVVGNTTVAS